MKAPQRVDLTWTGKPKYLGGRTIRPGDPLSVSRSHARIYKALGVATDTPEQPAAVLAPPQPATPPSDDLEALRARYKDRYGNSPDLRWGVIRLRNALAAGAPRYQRRDMQAE